VRVYIWHLRTLGYCHRQMRVWCKAHGISWRTLIDEGIDAEELLRLDDSSLSVNAIEFARSTGWSKTPVEIDSNTKNGRCV